MSPTLQPSKPTDTAKVKEDANSTSVEARLDALEHKLDHLVDMVGQLSEMVPATIAMAADSIDGALDDAHKHGIDVDTRLTKGALLLERISREETLDQLTQLVAALGDMPHFVAMVGDIVDETINRAEAAGYDIDALTVALQRGDFAREARDAIDAARKQHHPGVFGLTRALNDSDTQRGLMMALAVAKALGKTAQHTD
jgi:uncharacterized protein YjgD (DUF1641 family)